MGIFFAKPEPIFSQQQQQKIKRQTLNTKTQLIKFKYSYLIGEIHDFYHNFVDSIIKETSNEYIIKLEIKEISNILNNFEVLKRVNLLNHNDRIKLFNRIHMKYFFGPLLAGIISKKSKLINMDRKDLRKFQRKFNSIFPSKYSEDIKNYEDFNKEEFRKMRNNINRLHDRKKSNLNKKPKFKPSLETIKQQQPAKNPSRTRRAVNRGFPAIIQEQQ